MLRLGRCKSHGCGLWLGAVHVIAARSEDHGYHHEAERCADDPLPGLHATVDTEGDKDDDWHSWSEIHEDPEVFCVSGFAPALQRA